MPRLTPTEIDEITSLLTKTEEGDVQDRIDDWSKSFIASATEQFANTQWLSDKQINKLKDIVEGRDEKPKERGRSGPGKTSYTPRGGGFSGFES